MSLDTQLPAQSQAQSCPTAAAGTRTSSLRRALSMAAVWDKTHHKPYGQKRRRICARFRQRKFSTASAVEPPQPRYRAGLAQPAPEPQPCPAQPQTRRYKPRSSLCSPPGHRPQPPTRPLGQELGSCAWSCCRAAPGFLIDVERKRRLIQQKQNSADEKLIPDKRW